MVEASVDVFVPYLTNLSGLLDRAAAYADAQHIDAAALLAMRLAPDMFNLTRQVCEANRHAIIACALLAGQAAPATEETDADIPELKARIGRAVAFVQSLPVEAIQASADREVVFAFRSGATRAFTGRSLLLTFSLPQFFFHVTTAYDILRHAGVPLAKPDFLGPPRSV
ncbi:MULTISPECIES: DUF1993 domain-containing protein [unclassified Bradyrhizobium]|uniref:DUF1993 domain-containing protein n=1 Tax=unclassified Bradyrhizobium TaxID=2631580 RepID=UPI0028E4328C|nr:MULTISPECIES: DUF1993 domain-containing protein [unclassified Bradyrhizobium]